MDTTSGSGSGMNKTDHIFESLEKIFWMKILKFFDADPGSGLEKIRIRDGKNSDPDPQHWKKTFKMCFCDVYCDNNLNLNNKAVSKLYSDMSWNDFKAKFLFSELLSI
jgi:hypothetical protein